MKAPPSLDPLETAALACARRRIAGPEPGRRRALTALLPMLAVMLAVVWMVHAMAAKEQMTIRDLLLLNYEDVASWPTVIVHRKYLMSLAAAWAGGVVLVLGALALTCLILQPGYQRERARTDRLLLKLADAAGVTPRDTPTDGRPPSGDET